MTGQPWGTLVAKLPSGILICRYYKYMRFRTSLAAEGQPRDKKLSQGK